MAGVVVGNGNIAAISECVAQMIAVEGYLCRCGYNSFLLAVVRHSDDRIIARRKIGGQRAKISILVGLMRLKGHLTAIEHDEVDTLHHVLYGGGFRPCDRGEDKCLADDGSWDCVKPSIVKITFAGVPCGMVGVEDKSSSIAF